MEHYNKFCSNRSHPDIACICKKENQGNCKHEYKTNWLGTLTFCFIPGQLNEVCKKCGYQRVGSQIDMC